MKFYQRIKINNKHKKYEKINASDRARLNFKKDLLKRWKNKRKDKK